MMIIAKVKLPCDPATLEHAVHRAAHEGHWHDAKVTYDPDTESVIVSCPTEE